ncbi:MAG: hypothetical protein LLG06_08785 [Desulfobacteraceae bacterium]|nr:hypothetical protein [Desulfobacteraceae bacterium]
MVTGKFALFKAFCPMQRAGPRGIPVAGTGIPVIAIGVHDNMSNCLRNVRSPALISGNSTFQEPAMTAFSKDTMLSDHNPKVNWKTDAQPAGSVLHGLDRQ